MTDERWDKLDALAAAAYGAHGAWFRGIDANGVYVIPKDNHEDKTYLGPLIRDLVAAARERDELRAAAEDVSMERDMYEVAYRDLWNGVRAFLDFYEIGPDTETGIPEQSLRSLVMNGEPAALHPETTETGS